MTEETPDPRYCPECGFEIAGARPVSWGGWLLDERDDVLLALGKQVSLTRTESRIVAEVVRAKGQVVEKMRGLYSALCGNRPTADWPDQKMVDVIVCKVRRKIAKAGLPELFATSWGRGYYAVAIEGKKENAA